MVREIRVRWNTASGVGGVSVLYFDQTPAVAEQRAALQGWLANLEGGLHNTTSYEIETSGRELDTSSGALVGAWADPTPQAGTGTISGGSPVPDATQVLIRWYTGDVVAGRFLSGRTYIPGLAGVNVSGGNLAPTVMASYATDSQAYIDGTLGPVIWHRPTNGVGGVARPVTAASVWGELAVQRRRRG